MNYKPEDIYNADNLGLLYKHLPNTTLGDSHLSGQKQNIAQIGVKVCCSAIEEKVQLLNMNKSKKPSDF